MLIKDPASWDALRLAVQTMAQAPPGKFKYVCNQGNAGDALIAAGTWQFFDDAGVAPQFVSTRSIKAGDAAMYGGGGNLVGEYNFCRDFLRRCLSVGVSSALVLPHTIRGHKETLAQLDSRFTLVCRDVASLSWVRSTGSKANLIFAPDLALYLDAQRLFDRCDAIATPRTWMRFVRDGKMLRYVRWRRALKRLVRPDNGRISVIRVDVEATPQERGDPRWDVSNLYGSKYLFREEVDLVSRDYLQFFRGLKSVRTNRLHAGVAGALMDCEVTYLDNSYGKISAVYDAWLSHLPAVNFEGLKTA